MKNKFWNNFDDLLLTDNGSLRDIDFKLNNSTELDNLIRYFLANYSIVSIANENGIIPDEIDNIRDKFDSFINSYWQNPNKFIKKIQLLVDKEQEGGFSIEISFSPNDIDKPNYKRAKLVDFINELTGIGHLKQIFIKYENASWTYGDLSKSSGVIFYAEN